VTVYVSMSGDDANPGTADAPLLTIWEAISHASPGDTVRLLASAGQNGKHQ